MMKENPFKNSRFSAFHRNSFFFSFFYWEKNSHGDETLYVVFFFIFSFSFGEFTIVQTQSLEFFGATDDECVGDLHSSLNVVEKFLGYSIPVYNVRVCINNGIFFSRREAAP